MLACHRNRPLVDPQRMIYLDPASKPATRRSRCPIAVQRPIRTRLQQSEACQRSSTERCNRVQRLKITVQGRPLSSTELLFWRRHQLAEEVPGLYIRRLTLEDPRSAREPSSSRSQSPARHICHPTTGYVPSSRRSSSYRSWLQRIRKERPPFLTIVSLELPESPIPLIESQASARSRLVEPKDDVSAGIAERAALTDGEKETGTGRAGRKRSSRKSRGGRKSGEGFLECTKGAPTLEECTKNIVEGVRRVRLSNLAVQGVTDCICAEISGNVRVDVEAETGCESRSSSPDVTHTIRIAMRQHDRAALGADDDEETEASGRSGPETSRRNAPTARKPPAKEEEAGDGVNDALEFTLNCSSVRLTCRDTSLRNGTPGEKQQRLETRN